MKKPSDFYTIGQEISLTMIKGQKGSFPISRTEEGIICIIKRPEDPRERKFLPYDSVWNCQITEVHDNKLTIKPLVMLLSADQVKAEISDKLSTSYVIKPTQKKRKEPQP